MKLCLLKQAFYVKHYHIPFTEKLLSTKMGHQDTGNDN